jgi:TldD protein
VEPGSYDLVIDPTNLWLTIHESIGHATELDRALGYEANYAGTSFATPGPAGTLEYGSPVMHVTGDRTDEHGLATIGWDDEGVRPSSGTSSGTVVLVGYQLDRPPRSCSRLRARPGPTAAPTPTPRGHIAIQRMANVSLLPAEDGPDGRPDLQVDDGLYVLGDKSWSIDMQRYNFQFTAQRFVRIRNGGLAGQLSATSPTRARTTAVLALAGRCRRAETWWLGGAFNCGKAQPGQVAPVSHGCPVALLRGVNVLNTAQEGQR